MSRKRWIENPCDKKAAVELARECDADVFATLLLSARGIDTPEKISGFLDSENAPFSNPFDILDMDLAVARITSAIENEEKILVYGDYDADGVTATAVLYGYLSSIGADASYFIPSRINDGYGLSPKTAQAIVDRGVDLIITVDNGISSVEEARFFRENGIDMIVTDHHTVGEEIPDCIAVINPHRPEYTSPEKDFAGCGVAFKLISALEGGDSDYLAPEFLDLVAIGTIADIVPLVGENRTIVQQGLKILSETSRPGLARLIEALGLGGKELKSTDVAFCIAPKINAAGRVYDASLALDLILCDDYDTAEVLVEKLLSANSERQEIENDMLLQIEKDFDDDPFRRCDKVIVASGENFHPGVLGIAASRLLEKYSRPAFVITTDGSGIAKGSARSVPGFHLYEALSAVSDMLVRFGGHRQAAGFALKDEDIELFRRRINDYALAFDDIFPTIQIDCRLNAEKMTPEMTDSLELLQPFGAENPEPVFSLHDMRVSGIKALRENRHIRVTLSNSRATVNAMYFGMSTDRFPYAVGDLVDIAFRVEKNEYQGNTGLSVQIKDIRSAGVNEDGLFGSLSAYYNFCRGAEDARTKKALCPDRLFITTVYKYIRDEKTFAFSPEILCNRLGTDAADAGKAQICLDALTEMNLIIHEGAAYKINPKPARVDLTDSVILQRLGYKNG